MKFKSQIVLLAMAILFGGLLNLNAVAQDIPTLEEHQKAVILFDARISKMVEEAKEYGGSEGIDNIPMDGPFSGIKPSDMKRIFGAASLPKDMSFIGAMMMGPPDELPMEFFVRIEFKDADLLEKFQSKLAAESRKVEFGGKEFLAPQNGPLALAHRIDETTMEFGTKAYCLQEKRNFFTDRLSTAYKTAPNEPLRIVMDLETRADLIKEVVGMAKTQMQQMQMGGAAAGIAEGYLDLIDNAKSIVFTQTTSGENLATLMIEGVDEEQAAELKGGLGSAFLIVKGAAGQQMPQMKAQMKVSDKSIAVIKSIVDDLKATQEGTSVNVLIKKPEGFAEAAKEMQLAMAESAKTVQKMKNFRMMGLASLNYESAHREFPYQTKDGVHEDMSWRVKVLPFIEQNNLYDEITMDVSPRDEANSKFADKMPELYGTDGKSANVSWIQSTVKGFANITDGSSNTIMLIENPNAGPWMQNKPISVDDAIKMVTELKDGEQLVAVLYDCSVQMLDNKMDKDNLRNMLEPADGNRIER